MGPEARGEWSKGLSGSAALRAGDGQRGNAARLENKDAEEQRTAWPAGY